MSDETPKLQKYFENDPPSLFDELDVTNIELEGKFDENLILRQNHN